MNDKKYLSITEVSELLKINKHVIRYWDSKFDGISTRLKEKKRRYFNKDNIKKIEKLKDILYQNGKHYNYSLDLANQLATKKNSIYENTYKHNNSISNKKIIIEELTSISKDLKKLLES